VDQRRRSAIALYTKFRSLNVLLALLYFSYEPIVGGGSSGLHTVTQSQRPMQVFKVVSGRYDSLRLSFYSWDAGVNGMCAQKHATTGSKQGREQFCNKASHVQQQQQDPPAQLTTETVGYMSATRGLSTAKCQHGRRGASAPQRAVLAHLPFGHAL
jgi:hypothetical protein